MMAVRRFPGLVAFVIGLVFLTPLVYVFTAESWMAGLSDAESDDSLFLASCSDIAIDGAPLVAGGHAPILVALSPVTDEPTLGTAVRSALSPRAPPASSA